MFFTHQTEHIGLYINIASHLIRRTADSFSAHYGLTGIQSRILSYLAGVPDREIFQKDIEQHFGIRRSSVTSVISNLEQNGFLERRKVAGDARLKKLVLTENGLEVVQELTHSIDEFEQTLSDCFTGKEREEFLWMLKRIIQKLGCANGCDLEHRPAENNDHRKDGTL